MSCGTSHWSLILPLSLHAPVSVFIQAALKVPHHCSENLLDLITPCCIRQICPVSQTPGMLSSPFQSATNCYNKPITPFFFWLLREAYQILVPQPGIKPRLLAVTVQSPNHRTTREFPKLITLTVHGIELESLVFLNNFLSFVDDQRSFLTIFPDIKEGWYACSSRLEIFFSRQEPCMQVDILSIPPTCSTKKPGFGVHRT